MAASARRQRPFERAAVTWLSLLTSLHTLLGCSRRLPGLGECERFAEVWLGTTWEQLRAAAPEDEAFAQSRQVAFAEQVHQCLTLPYDRELVQCATDQAIAKQSCWTGFLRRSEQREPGARPDR
jgi:hypothetical protein